MPGNNFGVEVRSSGREHFDAAVRLAFANAVGGQATHFITPIPARSCKSCGGSGKKGQWDTDRKVFVEYPCPKCKGVGAHSACPGMVLLWAPGSIGNVVASPLPFPLSVDAAADFLWRYWESAAFGPAPDIDGSTEKGFIVTTGDFWGTIKGCHYAFLGVFPDWQLYGK